jgi:hypothetical protein
VAVPKNKVRSVIWSGEDRDRGTVTLVYESGPPNISPGSHDDAVMMANRHFAGDCTEMAGEGTVQWDRGR